MKARTLLVVALAIASAFSIVGCASNEGNDVKLEKTTTKQAQDDGLSLRKPATPGSGAVGNTAKPSTE